MLTQRLADHHSATCFLNSLLLEWKNYETVGNTIKLSLGPDADLIIPVKNFSLLGRHEYTGEFYLQTSHGQKQISFWELTNLVTDYLALKFETTAEKKEHFLNRVKNSHGVMYQTLEKRLSEFNRMAHPDFKTAEQALFVGHAFHPTPKSREEFSDEDLSRYSPEMAGCFPLEWFFVSKDIFFQKVSAHFNEENWLQEIYAGEVPEGFVPFPVHPWQSSHLMEIPAFRNHLAGRKILKAAATSRNWLATSSLRTLFAEDSRFMLKFSMSVRLTNSIRHLLVHELDRGLQIHEVFLHPEGKKFLKEHPEFEVIHEPVYAGLLDSFGNPIQESLVMGRLNPFQKSSHSIMLATLTQDHPEFKENLVQRIITSSSMSAAEWFEKLLQVAIRPLIIAQANYGILLGSHQQNMILELKEYIPHKSYFRDCNGTGYSHLGFSLFAQDIKLITPENGNILDKDPAQFLFGYYVVINSAFNIIAAIARDTSTSERELISVFKNFLLALKESGLKDPSFIDYLLESEHLMHKGNFLCSFRNINENTESNPLSIYTTILNPLRVRT